MNKITVIGLILICFILGNVFADDAVLLRFKFQEGEILKYQWTAQGKGTLGLSSPDTTLNAFGFNQTYPVDLAMKGDFRLETKSVADNGNATITFHFDKFDLALKLFGINYRVELVDNKMKIYTGEQLFMEENMENQPGMSILKDGFTMTFTNRGELLDFQMPEMDELQPQEGELPYPIPGMPDWKKQAKPILPEQPASSGQYWESTTKAEVPAMITLSRPIEVIQKYMVDKIESDNGGKKLYLTINSDNDYSDLSIGFNPLLPGLVPGMDTFNIQLKKFIHQSENKWIFGINSGQITTTDGNQSLDMELFLKFPRGGDESPMEMTVTLKGTMTDQLELL